ncbi:MAG TPA: histidine kinase [Cyclobacteriaceae bacterium]|nr:histidine kinase [Cyclobacteriaceae bacterium]
MDKSQSGIKQNPSPPLPEVRLNDNLMRLIGIPFFGIIIPNISGLFGHLTFHDLNYWLGYPYFVALSGAIWQGNRYLMFRTRKRFTWFDKPIEKLILLVINNIFFTTPLTVAWLCLWYRWAGFEKVNWEVILIVTLINVITVLFVIHIYETVFMVKEQENEQLLNANLTSAKAKAELEALKNQIDPHFMFNSLNSLSYLISTNPHKATQFTENLADIYRYILSQKDQTLVLLEDELNFTKKYIDLLELRFGKALTVRKHFNGTTEREYLIPPISAFVAMENAVKHNEISESTPLEIDLLVNDQVLTIKNKIQVKRSIKHSSKIGLKNMDDRFRIITGKGIKTRSENGYFNVNLPLMPLSQ